jgi:hypothetical protein
MTMEKMYEIAELIAHAKELSLKDLNLADWQLKKVDNRKTMSKYYSRPKISWEESGKHYTAEIIVTWDSNRAEISYIYTCNGIPITLADIAASFARLRAAAAAKGEMQELDAAIAKLTAENGIYAYQGHDYVLTQPPYVDGHDYYRASAIRVDSVCDTNGYVLAYDMQWDIIDDDTDDASNACDWDNPSSCELVPAVYYNPFVGVYY